jgi:hypothetical protein
MQVDQSKNVNYIVQIKNLLKPKKMGIYTNSTSSPDKTVPVIKAGDMVRVRSVEEIKSTLDRNGKYEDGLLFIDEMTKYCGNSYRVLKRVNKIFDSKVWRMKKSHDIVILEGVFCHGYGAYQECDRTCPFFWKDAWLEKM